MIERVLKFVVWCLFGNPVGIVWSVIVVVSFAFTLVRDAYMGRAYVPARKLDTRVRLFSYEQRMEVIRRDGARCAYCGATGALEVDHIVPFSVGGPTETYNAQLLCGAGHGCGANQWKSAQRDDVARAEFVDRFGVAPVTGMQPPVRVAPLWERVYGRFPHPMWAR